MSYLQLTTLIQRVLSKSFPYEGLSLDYKQDLIVSYPAMLTLGNLVHFQSVELSPSRIMGEVGGANSSSMISSKNKNYFSLE